MAMSVPPDVVLPELGNGSPTPPSAAWSTGSAPSRWAGRRSRWRAAGRDPAPDQRTALAGAADLRRRDHRNRGRRLADLADHDRPFRLLAQQARAISAQSNPDEVQVRGVREAVEIAEAVEGMLARIGSEQARTKAALESARDFAAVASHELRTPLTAMRTNLEVLSTLDLEAEQRNEVIGDVIRTQSRIEATLTALERLAQGELTTADDFVPFDVTELLDRAAHDAERTYPDLRVALVPSPVVLMVGLPVGLRLVIDNAIANAVKHGVPPRSGSACSVPPTALRSPSTTTAAGPRGGAHRGLRAVLPRLDGVAVRLRTRLALVAQQAELHGGTAHLSTSPLGGAQLVLRLAATSRMEPAPCPPDRPPQPGRSATAADRPEVLQPHLAAGDDAVLFVADGDQPQLLSAAAVDGLGDGEHLPGADGAQEVGVVVDADHVAAAVGREPDVGRRAGHRLDDRAVHAPWTMPIGCSSFGWTSRYAVAPSGVSSVNTSPIWLSNGASKAILSVSDCSGCTHLCLQGTDPACVTRVRPRKGTRESLQPSALRRGPGMRLRAGAGRARTGRPNVVSASSTAWPRRMQICSPAPVRSGIPVAVTTTQVPTIRHMAAVLRAPPVRSHSSANSGASERWQRCAVQVASAASPGSRTTSSVAASSGSTRSVGSTTPPSRRPLGVVVQPQVSGPGVPGPALERQQRHHPARHGVDQRRRELLTRRGGCPGRRPRPRTSPAIGRRPPRSPAATTVAGRRRPAPPPLHPRRGPGSACAAAGSTRGSAVGGRSPSGRSADPRRQWPPAYLLARLGKPNHI